MTERKYFILSLKHLFPWKFGQPLCLWGCKRTADNEPRCFCGYNTKPSTSELYTIEEYLEKYGKYNAVKKEPIKNFFVCTFKGLKKHYDDVLVEKESVDNYYKMCDLEL